MATTVKIIDKDSPYFGQEVEGHRWYYDHLHTGDSPDLFVIQTSDGEKQILSTGIDIDHYKNQLLTREKNRLSASVGDEVMITKSGSGSFCRGWDISTPHFISEICSSGHIYFDGYPNGGACIFRPEVQKI